MSLHHTKRYIVGLEESVDLFIKFSKIFKGDSGVVECLARLRNADSGVAEGVSVVFMGVSGIVRSKYAWDLYLKGFVEFLGVGYLVLAFRREEFYSFLFLFLLFFGLLFCWFFIGRFWLLLLSWFFLILLWI